jgi:hypothetical protein
VARRPTRRRRERRSTVAPWWMRRRRESDCGCQDHARRGATHARRRDRNAARSLASGWSSPANDGIHDRAQLPRQSATGARMADATRTRYRTQAPPAARQPPLQQVPETDCGGTRELNYTRRRSWIVGASRKRAARDSRVTMMLARVCGPLSLRSHSSSPPVMRFVNEI